MSWKKNTVSVLLKLAHSRTFLEHGKTRTWNGWAWLAGLLWCRLVEVPGKPLTPSAFADCEAPVWTDGKALWKVKYYWKQRKISFSRKLCTMSTRESLSAHRKQTPQAGGKPSALDLRLCFLLLVQQHACPTARHRTATCLCTNLCALYSSLPREARSELLFTLFQLTVTS